MKSNNCLRIRVLTRNACLHLAYVFPLGERVLNQCMQLVPPTVGYAHKKSCAYHHVFKSIESLDGDHGMDRYHYAVPFKGILIRSTPEIVLSSKGNNYKKAKKKVGLSRMTDLFCSSCNFCCYPSCSIFFASYPQPFYPVSESLFVCFLSERFFLDHAKAPLAIGGITWPKHVHA